MYRLDGKDDETLTHLIRGGFLNIDEVKEAFLQGHLDQDDLGPEGVAEANAEIDRRFANKIIDDDATTDFLYDRLDAAFLRLNEQDSVVARHHARGTRQEAKASVGSICREWGGSAAGVLGGLFYTDQDLGQAIREGVLRLGFFAVGPDRTTCDAGLEKMMPIVMQRLKDEGLPAHWNGDHHRRIEIQPITWSKQSPAVRDARPSPRHAHRSPITGPDPDEFTEEDSITPIESAAEGSVVGDSATVPQNSGAAPRETAAEMDESAAGARPESEVIRQDSAADPPASSPSPAPSPSPGPSPVPPTNQPADSPNTGLLGRLGKRLFRR